MSHNKILRRVLGVSTGIMLFGMNMVQASFASENITAVSYTHLDVYKRQGSDYLKSA